MEIRVIRLEKRDAVIFPRLCEWYHSWIGARGGESPEETEYTFAHSLCGGVRLPQTFAALADGVPAGMYQLAMADDLTVRPDLYPWLINVYTDVSFRNRGVCVAMMRSVPQNAAAAGLNELWLYTEHTGLYERFGWQYAGSAPVFRGEHAGVRLYRLEIGPDRNEQA